MGTTDEEPKRESSVEVRVTPVGDPPESKLAASGFEGEKMRGARPLAPGKLCSMRRTREGVGAEASIDTDQGIMLGPVSSARTQRTSRAPTVSCPPSHALRSG